jgi:CubicO group peptidase (beta-lactamase class C family)
LVDFGFLGEFLTAGRKGDENVNDELAHEIRHGRIGTRPEQAGYDPHVLERLDSHFQRLVADDKLQAASYLLARNGEIFACRAMGKLCYDDGQKPLQSDSIRKVYSITKMFTAVATLILVEAGLLRLDQPVADFLEEFGHPGLEKITIQHLLTHTSGIMADPGYFGEPYGRSWFEHLEYRQEWNWIRNTLAGRLHAEPGTEWNYSSAGFSILGEVLHRASGVPYERFVRTRICEPLRMQRTFFAVPESLRDQVCVVSEWQRDEAATVEDRPDRPPRAGNGLFSTLSDLFRFGQMLLNGGTLDGATLLGRKSIELLSRNQLKQAYAYHWGKKKENYRYGLGVSLNDESLVTPGTYSHEGFGRSCLYIDPVEQLVVVYFIPMSEGFNPEAVIHSRAIIWSGILPGRPSSMTHGREGVQ